MKITRRDLGLALNAALAAKAPAEEPAALVWNSKTIRWQPTAKDGTKYAVLDGSRDTPGVPFVYAFWMPGGVWVAAHHHSQSAYVAVMEGEILLGWGGRMDKSKTRRLQAGEFFIVRGGVPHFEGSEGPCLIIGTALGGWKTTELEGPR